MTCKIVAFIAMAGPPYLASGSQVAMFRCETHDFTPVANAPHGLCPIGRIEQATAAALTQIEGKPADAE
jgi:hypothetical protein